jgi:hydroxyacylglutathione hydrolase
MEEVNLDGSARSTYDLTVPQPLTTDLFNEKAKGGSFILDVRSPEAICGALIPGSLGIPLEMIPAFAGWFLPDDRDLLLVANDYDDVDKALLYLTRIGFDSVAGYLSEELHAWEVSGRSYETIPAVHTAELVRRIEDEEDFLLLDVRKKSEYQEQRLPGATHVYVGELPDNLESVPRNKPIVTFCGSGQRAVIAATILKRQGYDRVENGLGSIAACAAVGCPLVEGKG